MDNPCEAMVFAAGLGTRMGALVEDKPKPMLPINNRPLIDRTLDMVQNAGCTRAVVNLHYKAGVLESHLRHRTIPQIVFSDERAELLETGGGLREAARFFEQTVVFTVNSDVIWGRTNPLSELSASWRTEMSALLLLGPRSRVRPKAARADFTLDNSGRISRAKGASGYTYLGAQIIDAKACDAGPDGPFSLNLIWDELIVQGRAFGLVYHDEWTDIGSAEAYAAAQANFGNDA